MRKDSQTGNTDALVIIDEIEVAPKEFRQAIRDHRAIVAARLCREHQIADANRLWDGKFEAIDPIAEICETALASLVRNKAHEAVAIENGVRPTSIDVEQVNQRRFQHQARGELVVGPEQYTERALRNRTIDAMIAATKTKLAEEKFEITDSAIRKRYEQTVQPTMEHTVRVATAPIPPGEKENVINQMTELRDAWSERRNDTTGLLATNHITIDTRIITAQSPSNDGYLEGSDRCLLDLAASLHVGEVSDVVQVGNQATLLTLIERNRQHEYSFDVVRDVLRQAIIDERYDAIIDERVSQASVVSDQTRLREVAASELIER